MQDIPLTRMVRDIIFYHHERLDGGGYPRGLKGDEIPVGARILAVADAYDSMTIPHTQRPAMPPEMGGSPLGPGGMV